MATHNDTGAPAPTQPSKLTDSELEQEFVQDLKKLSREQRSEIYQLIRELKANTEVGNE